MFHTDDNIRIYRPSLLECNRESDQYLYETWQNVGSGKLIKFLLSGEPMFVAGHAVTATLLAWNFKWVTDFWRIDKNEMKIFFDLSIVCMRKCDHFSKGNRNVASDPFRSMSSVSAKYIKLFNVLRSS